MLRYILIKLLKIKYKEEMLKAARKKQLIPSTRKPEWIFWPTQYKIIPIKVISWFFSWNSAGQKGWAYYKWWKGKNLHLRLFYAARLSFKFERNQKLYRQEKAKRIQHHHASFTRIAKSKKPRRREWKRKRRKETYKNKLKAIKKMAIEHIYQ